LHKGRGARLYVGKKGCAQGNSTPRTTVWGKWTYLGGTDFPPGGECSKRWKGGGHQSSSEGPTCGERKKRGNFFDGRGGGGTKGLKTVRQRVEGGGGFFPVRKKEGKRGVRWAGKGSAASLAPMIKGVLY